MQQSHGVRPGTHRPPQPPSPQPPPPQELQPPPPNVGSTPRSGMRPREQELHCVCTMPFSVVVVAPVVLITGAMGFCANTAPPAPASQRTATAAQRRKLRELRFRLPFIELLL